MGSASSAEPFDVAAMGRVHIIGIGGAGMSGIARILLARGVTVTGSDAKDSRRVAAVRALGAHVDIGHDGAHVANADTVVASTAVKATNPEIVAANQAGLTVLSRAEALAAVMAGFRSVAVSGTHGKTTTTSMLTVALQHCGADPSFVIGSELNESGSNAHDGRGDIFIAEADESDGSFLQLGAIAGIVTNVEPDHLDHWQTFDAVEAAFDDFTADIDARGGFSVVCTDDPGGAALATRARAAGRDVRTYGEDEGADFRVVPVGDAQDPWRFAVVINGVRHQEVRLQVPGKHNMLNATAALVVGVGLGFPVGLLLEGLEQFTGTRRRFEFRGNAAGVRVYDDYAHHPTEIAATLRAARRVVGDGRLIVAFQAHHYYRTALFTKEFGESLGLADDVVVLEVFAPGEDPIPGASGQVLAANVPLEPDHVVFEPSWSKVPQRLAERAKAGDIVMTLGAGDISMMGPEVLDLLAKRDRYPDQVGAR